MGVAASTGTPPRLARPLAPFAFAGLAACLAAFAAGPDERPKLYAAGVVSPGRTVAVTVPGDVPDLAGALEAVSAWEIPPRAAVVIELGPGIHPLRGRVTIDHPDGMRLAIVGKGTLATPTVLRWDDSPAGLYVGDRGALGRLENLCIEHVERRTRGAESGVLADEGALIRCGPDVAVSGFYYGFTARRNGTLRCDGARVDGAGDAGFFAYMGGHIDALGSRSTGADDRARQLGSGYVAEYGGTIDAADSAAEGCALAGFQALSGGSIRAERSRSERNDGDGFRVRTGGVIVAHGGTAGDNGGFGVNVWAGAGHFEGEGVVLRGNRRGATGDGRPAP